MGVLRFFFVIFLDETMQPIITIHGPYVDMQFNQQWFNFLRLFHLMFFLDICELIIIYIHKKKAKHS